MRLFLDSSALAKRYVQEPGTERVTSLCSQADEILLSILCVPEVLSGLNRLRRQGDLADAEYDEIKGHLARDIDAASVLDLGPSVLSVATSCLEAAPVRALDAIHVASAVTSRCDLFLSADRRQCQAARQMDLAVEDLSFAGGPSSGEG